jgi:S1-C subfamily serine protease
MKMPPFFSDLRRGSIYVCLLIVMLAIVGCANIPLQSNSPLQQGGAVSSYAAPELGIATDLKLQVTGLQPGSAAEKLDIQIGDILVDVKWLISAMPVDSPREGIVLDAEGRPTYNGVVITEPVPLPPEPPTLEQMKEYIETEAIPFTELNLMRIVYLIGYGVPLELRLMRNGEEIKLPITPSMRTQPLMKLPERTETEPDKHAYYYF